MEIKELVHEPSHAENPVGIAQPLTEQEFAARFTARLLRVSTGKTPMSEDEVRAYAAETAPSYFFDWQRAEPESTPEDWADCDFSYWED